MLGHNPIEWAEQRRKGDIRAEILLLLLNGPSDDDTILSSTTPHFVLSSAEIGWRTGQIMRELREEEMITEKDGKICLTDAARTELEQLRRTLPSTL